MSVFDKLLKTVRINIVDRVEWKRRWDPVDMEWPQQAAWEEFAGASHDFIKDLVFGLASKALNKNEYRYKFTDEMAEAVIDSVRENSERSESIRQIITDTLVDAWVIAFTPDDGDIEHALKLAKKELPSSGLSDHWNLVVQKVTGPKEWRPGPLFDQKFVEQQLFNEIRYERKPGYYDRYIVFSFWKSEALQALLETVKRFHGDELYYYRDSINRELEGMMEDVMAYLFAHLERYMDDVTINDRVNFHKQWRKVLEGSYWKDAVRKELHEFMREA